MGTETVLFVDDEIYLAEVGKEMLEDYGYTVDISIKPLDAMVLFEQDPDRYDLLITDYTMPEMTGDMLIEKIHGIRPDLPVIVCSGTQLPLEVTRRITISRMLMKPFDMDDLLGTVRKVLDTPGDKI